MQYQFQRAIIRKVFTHAEYDAWNKPEIGNNVNRYANYPKCIIFTSTFRPRGARYGLRPKSKILL